MIEWWCLLSLYILEKVTVFKSGQFVIVYSVTRLLIYFLNVPLCPDCGALWDSGRGTLGQSGSFLQHDLYNVNIILADGLIVTSPLEMEWQQ